MYKLTKNIILFDWIAAVLNILFFGGLFYDFWTHVHTDVVEKNTFFSPSHYFFYGAYGLEIIFFTLILIYGLKKRIAWRKILPKGYNLSFLGLLVFGFGGLFDFVWHSLFGFEQSINALLSPAHLLLAIGITLAATGPVRSIFSRFQTRNNLALQLPALIGVIITLAVIQATTIFTSPMVRVFPLIRFSDSQAYTILSLGVSGVFIHCLVYLSFFLFLIKQKRAYPGFLGTIYFLNTILILFMSYQPLSTNIYLALSALFTGILFEIILKFLRNSNYNNLWFLKFSLIPMVMNLSYFITLIVLSRVTWAIHLVGGTIFASMLMGFLLSYLILSPQPDKSSEK